MTLHILNIGHPSAYMHFESTGLAQFAPQLLPNIEFIETCCYGKGWKFRWRSKLNGYDSSNDSPPDSDALRSHMYALRRAMDRPFPRPLLQTLHGIGYRLVDPDEAAL